MELLNFPSISLHSTISFTTIYHGSVLNKFSFLMVSFSTFRIIFTMGPESWSVRIPALFRESFNIVFHGHLFEWQSGGQLLVLFF